MSPNSDNAMARFLFAILKQKNLKDIDWNQVAQDPVLLQPITNGHAARMRYSRFRATVTGSDSQKRQKPGDKGRISKTKAAKKDGIIKSESTASLSSYAQYSPDSAASPYAVNDRKDASARFPTPCSDDMAQGLGINPAAVENHNGSHQNPADYSPSLDFMDNMDSLGIDQSPAFSAFDDATIDFTGFGAADTQSHDMNSLQQSSTDCTPGWSDHNLHLQF